MSSRSSMRTSRTTSAYARTVKLISFVGVMLLSIGCSSKAPSKTAGAPTRAPDDSYETDGALAWRVLIWKCDATNERIAMIQTCGEGLTGCNDWKLERTPCPTDPVGRDAARTPTERDVEARGQGRHPIPSGYGWR